MIYLGKIKTYQELALAAGVSVQTIYRWRKWGLDRLKDSEGFWKPSEVLEWAAKKKKTRIKQKRPATEFQQRDIEKAPIETTEEEDIEEEKDWSNVYRKAKAEKETILVEQLKGELISRSDMETMFSDRAREVKKQLVSLGKRLAPRLEGLQPREIETEITKETIRICNNYSRSINL